MDKQEAATEGFSIALAGAQKSGKPYLGDPEAVRQIVHEFASNVLKESPDIEGECKRLAKIFSGQDDGYVATMWNDGGGYDGPPGLAKHLLKEVPGLDKWGSGLEELLGAFFGMLAQRLWLLAKERLDGKSLAWYDNSVGALVDFAAKILIGLPNKVK